MILIDKEVEEVAMRQKSLLETAFPWRKIKEIRRLKLKQGLTHQEIAKSCGDSTSMVSEYATHTKAAGLSWSLPESLIVFTGLRTDCQEYAAVLEL
jgi:hypothetical protein